MSAISKRHPEGRADTDPDPGGHESAIERIGDRIVHFDATLRRRQRLRQSASGLGRVRAAAQPDEVAESSSDSAAEAPSPRPSTERSFDPPASADPGRTWWQRVMREFEPGTGTDAAPSPDAVAAAPPPNGTPSGSGDSGDPAGLRRFLINFVVEQTGYPEEIVELDADLEADLGIDSIKKAQMFGEIGEQFAIQPDENLSLDDFPTLRQVLDYLVKATGAAGGEDVVPTPGQSAGRFEMAAEASPPSPEAAPRVESAVPSDDAKSSREDLRSFLVNFVVEQTGYPEEIVELEADLEADLGIDSIKKAQMFGEIGEYFGLEPDDNLSLDDFPTLATVLVYLEANVRR